MRAFGRAVATAAGLAFVAPESPGAFEILASAGVDDLRGDRVAAVGLEARTGELATWRAIALRLGAAAERDDDFWVGAGPVLTAPLLETWRIEASVMLGAYSDRGGNDLGAEFPIFRSSVGVSRPVAERWRLGVSVNHKSNAGTSSVNPGVETLLFSVIRTF